MGMRGCILGNRPARVSAPGPRIPNFGVSMSDWFYERWKENKWTPIFMPARRGDGAHDDMIFASALATKALWDSLPWWKKVWLRIKALVGR